jgi:hypothetical protein
MNKLPAAKRAQILHLLVEGSSMRSVARIADVSINTVFKLQADAGRACAAFHHETVAPGGRRRGQSMTTPRRAALAKVAEGMADDLQLANLLHLAAFGLMEDCGDETDVSATIAGLRRLTAGMEERGRQVDRLLKGRRPRKPASDRGKPALRVVT